jgi:hypothetical protein
MHRPEVKIHVMVYSTNHDYFVEALIRSHRTAGSLKHQAIHQIPLVAQ